MSKRGKQKKAENVERRRLQMAEALECLAVKQAAERKMGLGLKRKPAQCSFRHCLRYVDPSSAVCPYCGRPLPDKEPVMAPFQGLTLSGC